MNVGEGLRRLGILLTVIWLLGILFAVAKERQYAYGDRSKCSIRTTRCQYEFWEWRHVLPAQSVANESVGPRKVRPDETIVLDHLSDEELIAIVAQESAKSSTPAPLEHVPTLMPVEHDPYAEFSEIVVQEPSSSTKSMLMPRWDALAICLVGLPVVFWLLALGVRWVILGFRSAHGARAHQD